MTRAHGAAGYVEEAGIDQMQRVVALVKRLAFDLHAHSVGIDERPRAIDCDGAYAGKLAQAIHQTTEEVVLCVGVGVMVCRKGHGSDESVVGIKGDGNGFEREQ